MKEVARQSITKPIMNPREANIKPGNRPYRSAKNDAKKDPTIAMRLSDPINNSSCAVERERDDWSNGPADVLTPISYPRLHEFRAAQSEKMYVEDVMCDTGGKIMDGISFFSSRGSFSRSFKARSCKELGMTSVLL
jgi:hypothetical protein